MLMDLKYVCGWVSPLCLLYICNFNFIMLIHVYAPSILRLYVTKNKCLTCRSWLMSKLDLSSFSNTIPVNTKHSNKYHVNVNFPP